MGYDRYYTIYHLTPDGFVLGLEVNDDDPTDLGPIPENRIETWLQIAESHDTWGKMHYYGKKLWVSPDYSEEERKQIRARFRRPFSLEW